jgi:uncharacterized membrane protein
MVSLSECKAAADAVNHSASKHSTTTRQQDRISALTQALNLDAAQQIQLKKILSQHHEQIQKVWNDVELPPARRVAATQAISDHTADQIRAMLTEEQRKKYNAPRPPRDPQADSSKRSVEDWMNATQPKR